jgi:hypothetical protein
VTGTVVGGQQFCRIIDEICAFPWSSMTSDDMVDVAWAYYFFSIQFRESLDEARRLYPTDDKLRRLEEEECDTDNLSPWPGVAVAGERMNHDEYMRRALALMSHTPAKTGRLEAIGQRYLSKTRSQASQVRAAALASYENGGLERVFKSMLKFANWDNELLKAFAHFLQEHVRFDSCGEQSHGALCRHFDVDDQILPLWLGFRDLLVEAAPTAIRKP